MNGSPLPRGPRGWGPRPRVAPHAPAELKATRRPAPAAGGQRHASTPLAAALLLPPPTLKCRERCRTLAGAPLCRLVMQSCPAGLAGAGFAAVAATSRHWAAERAPERRWKRARWKCWSALAAVVVKCARCRSGCWRCVCWRKENMRVKGNGEGSNGVERRAVNGSSSAQACARAGGRVVLAAKWSPGAGPL